MSRYRGCLARLREPRVRPHKHTQQAGSRAGPAAVCQLFARVCRTSLWVCLRLSRGWSPVKVRSDQVRPLRSALPSENSVAFAVVI